MVKLKLCLAFVVVLLAWPRPARAQDEYGAALQRFGEALRALREGQESAAELERAARELCERFGRCDPLDVAAWYSALSREARAQGLRDEQRYVALWDEVREAGVHGLAGDDWAEQRERVLGELRLLAREAAERADFVPAAQALALSARIVVQQLESGSDLNVSERTELARRAQADAHSALELFGRAGQVTPRLEPELLLARLALARRDRAAARAGFEALLERAERVRRDDYREHALQGLLALARAAGDAREQDRLLEVLARFRDPLQSWPLARDWAARLLAEDHATRALEFLERCAPGEDAHASDRYEWELLCGSARLRSGDLPGAREHFERLATTADSELSLLALASLALREERPFEARALLGDEQRLAQLSPLGRERAHGLLGEAELAMGELGDAVAHLQQAFDAARESEAELRDERLDAASQAAGSVVGERLGLHTVALLAEALARSDRALEAVAVIEEAQARSLRRRAGLPGAPLDGAAVRAWASGFELGLLTWVVGADYALAAHVAPDGSARIERIEHGRAALDDAVRRAREAALAQGTPATRFEVLLRELGATLVPRAIAARLAALNAAAGSEPRLLVLAHGPTEALPFELLSWSELGTGADVALAVQPGLDAVAPGARLDPRALTDWTLLGAPHDSAGRDLLPSARDELDSIHTQRPGSQLWIGSDFVRARVLAACRGDTPLHIATHLEPRCERWRPFGAAALRTSDREPLCADEIAQARPALPLVVLSACWTGGGERVDAEGLFGLARAFLSGGTRNVLVTQWPVEDAAAAAFGAAFHRELERGASPARAAARARRELADAGAAAADFGAFRLLGRD